MGFLDTYSAFFSDAKEVISFFRQKYTMRFADTPELLRRSFELRHQIYCVEKGSLTKQGNNQEEDSYDRFSKHLVLYNNESSSYIACARLVPGRTSKSDELILPFEELCHDRLDQDIMRAIKTSGHGYAEISRLAIDKAYRQITRPATGTQKTSRLKTSCALLVMLFGIQAAAKLTHTKYMFALVERKLINTLRKFSIPVQEIGPPVEHYGRRYPIVMDADACEKIIPVILWPLYKGLFKSLASEFNSSTIGLGYPVDAISDIVIPNFPDTSLTKHDS